MSDELIKVGLEVIEELTAMSHEEFIAAMENSRNESSPTLDTVSMLRES